MELFFTQFSFNIMSKLYVNNLFRINTGFTLGHWGVFVNKLLGVYRILVFAMRHFGASP